MIKVNLNSSNLKDLHSKAQELVEACENVDRLIGEINETKVEIEYSVVQVENIKQTYQCLKCNHSFKGNPIKIEGTYCPECNGPIVPR